MVRHPKAFWCELVAEVESGATAVDVARRNRVRATTLSWWCSTLRRERRERDTVRLLPVVAAAAPASSQTQTLEVGVGAAVLRVEVGTDVDYVAALARALRSAC